MIMAAKRTVNETVNRLRKGIRQGVPEKIKLPRVRKKTKK